MTMLDSIADNLRASGGGDDFHRTMKRFSEAKQNLGTRPTHTALGESAAILRGSTSDLHIYS